MKDTERYDDKFDSYIGSHVFNRVLISIYDCQGDEYYKLDMPPDVYEELKRLINAYEKELKNGIKA